MYVCICTHIVAIVQSLRHAWLFATSGTVARQAPQSTEFPGKSIGVGFHFLLLYTFMCVCVCVCVYTYMYIYETAYVWVCMYVYMYMRDSLL